MKVMTVLGTRPEIIKLARVIPELDQHFEHVLVHTGQNYDPKLGEIFFKELKIRTPDESLKCEGRAVPAVGAMLCIIKDRLEKYNPDAVLILGDTNSCVAAAYAAKRAHIPLFHMEAGNRCFDQRTPEEINRKIVDHLADINMVYTEHARRNLLAEGVKPDTIIKTGSPMHEVLMWYRSAIEHSSILKRLELDPIGYFVVSMHREENVDGPENLFQILASCGTLSKNLGCPVVLPVHPRLRSRMPLEPPWGLVEGVQIIEPLGFLDYCHLQTNARCVISDSGTLTEEAAMLRFPAVMIRQSHERPEGQDSGATIMCDPVRGDLRAAVELAMNQPAGGVPEDYAPLDVARKVARIILSYTDFVNRTVWHK